MDLSDKQIKSLIFKTVASKKKLRSILSFFKMSIHDSESYTRYSQYLRKQE